MAFKIMRSGRLLRRRGAYFIVCGLIDPPYDQGNCLIFEEPGSSFL